jgi:hypothetical protein
MKSVFCVLFVAAASVVSAWAQTPASAQNRVSGTITAIDAAKRTVTAKSTTGETVELTVPEKAFVRHLGLGQAKPEDIKFSDLATGQEFVATFTPSPDGKTKEVRTIYIRTKSDLDAMVSKQDEDWKKRGTTGNLSAVDAASKSFTIKVGSKEIKVKPAEKAEYMRYSADSAKMSDAKPSSFAELKAGDEVHVLGDKNADGTEIAGEKVIFGTFPQLAATIKSVNAAANEMVVTDLATKKPITIRIASDSAMKKLPDMAAQMLARMYGAARGGAAGADGGGGRGQGRGAGGLGDAALRHGGDSPGGPGGPGGRGGRDVGQMLNQAPSITLADLKAGDAIMVKTTTGSGSGPATAVTLIAGVEPILTAAPNSTRDIMAGWSLGGGGGGEGN